MNANFGLLDPLPGKVRKDRKKELLVERARADFGAWLEESGVLQEKHLAADERR
jgi:folate-dependent tRNA-U54 methylase TrmFO/GidA